MSKSYLTSKSSELYEIDFYEWTIEQATFLREEKWNCLDVPNLLEEIESLGKQQRQELRNRLGVLLGHLLKWQFQPSHRSKSWVATIREQRAELLEIIEDSPSLKPYLTVAIEKAYQKGLNIAVRETRLDYENFPQECPYSQEQILNPEFPVSFKYKGSLTSIPTNNIISEMSFSGISIEQLLEASMLDEEELDPAKAYLEGRENNIEDYILDELIFTLNGLKEAK